MVKEVILVRGKNGEVISKINRYNYLDQIKKVAKWGFGAACLFTLGLGMGMHTSKINKTPNAIGAGNVVISSPLWEKCKGYMDKQLGEKEKPIVESEKPIEKLEKITFDPEPVGKLESLPEPVVGDGLEKIIKYHGLEKDVKKKIEEFTKIAKFKNGLEISMSESTKFEDYFQMAANESGLPKNLIKAYHIIETGSTGYNLKALSSAKARGPSQMLPPAAEESGLKIIINSKGVIYYDERCDPEQSIPHSAKYLARYVKEWDSVLGLLAYNAGPTFTRKQIKKKGSDKVKNLVNPGADALLYIKRALAIKTILDNPEEYGMDVTKKSLWSKIRDNTRLYKVKSGDNLYAISKNHHTNMDKLMGLNPALDSKNLLYPMVDIYVPK